MARALFCTVTGRDSAASPRGGVQPDSDSDRDSVASRAPSRPAKCLIISWEQDSAEHGVYAPLWESGDNRPPGQTSSVVLPQFGPVLKQFTLISSGLVPLPDSPNGFFIRRAPVIFHVTILASVFSHREACAASCFIKEPLSLNPMRSFCSRLPGQITETAI